MNHAEWLSCTNPTSMLEHVLTFASNRKRRLFGCACCRRVWTSLDAERQQGVETIERYVEGLASDDELIAVAQRNKNSGRAHYEHYRRLLDAGATRQEIDREFAVSQEGFAVNAAAELWDCSYPFAGTYTANLALMKRFPLHGPVDPKIEEEHESCRIEEAAAQAALLRDVFGDPFRGVAIKAEWKTSDVLALAQGIYAERAFDRMPILADALQDAGCYYTDILSHCRGPEPHVRGCWVVDLILGKT
jgi:hypothetical protein